MDWTDCILNPIGCTITATGSSAAESAWESFVRWAARGLSDLSATVFSAFSTSTVPRFDQKWWQDNLALMVAISLPVLVAVVVLQCVTAVIRRQPGGLGRALVGSLVGTAGVPLAVGVVSMCGTAVDQMSIAILGSDVTADGVARMFDISAVLTAATHGGFLLIAIFLGLISLFGLYFVMLLREVALLAFVVFAPVALVSWTWTATRHWLRRWIEIVGALIFSKIAMAVIFTLGVSAMGASGQGATSNLGTFLGGTLLVAMAAFAPMATFSFLHWAGDQGYAAARTLEEGSAGAAAAKDQVDAAQDWRADHFGGGDVEDDDSFIDGQDEGKYDGPGGERDHDGGDTQADGDDESSSSNTSVNPVGADLQQPTSASPAEGDGSTAIATATSNVVVAGDRGGSVQQDSTEPDSGTKPRPGEEGG